MQLCSDLPCVGDWIARNASIIIALAALFLSIWAALLTRLNARISALPLLHPFQQCTPERRVAGHIEMWHGELIAKLINGGLGPAVVTKYEAYADAVKINLTDRKDAQTKLANVFGLDPNATFGEWFFLEGAVAIPKDGVIPCLSVRFNVPAPDDFTRTADQIRRLRLRVEYQSMYGDELLFDSRMPSLPPTLGLFRRRKRPRGQ